MIQDLALPRFEWDIPIQPTKANEKLKQSVSVHSNPYKAMERAHGLCVLTEWDQFRTYDYKGVYETMVKPAYIFDGRNILDHEELRRIGFVVYSIGKPLDPFMKRS